MFGINLGTKMVANMDNNVYLYGVNIKVYRYDNSKCKRFSSQSRKVLSVNDLNCSNCMHLGQNHS